MIHTETIFVTPELALAWLGLNFKNPRKMDTRRVAAYISLIMRGMFRTTHQGIAFHKDGWLADGQHRLQAIYESGRGVYLQVSWGLEDEDVAVIDQNRIRKSGDVARYLGRPERGTHFAVARIISQGPAPTQFQPVINVLEVIDRLREGIEYSSNGNKFKGFTAHVRAPICRAFYTQDVSRLDEFKKVFSTGNANSPRDWAAIRLREAVSRGNGSRGAASNVREYFLTERALRLFIDGYPCKALYPAKEELFRIPGYDDEDGKVVGV